MSDIYLSMPTAYSGLWSLLVIEDLRVLRAPFPFHGIEVPEMLGALEGWWM
ncbi:MAG: hypothetical protein GF344_12340 [Chitinivibrionales bacterium]|nr:hypothetical protein [Chitinivibrionales bacterium]